MKVVVGVCLALLLSLLLAFPASCEEEQQQQQAAPGGGEAAGCQSLRVEGEGRKAPGDPEEAAHHWGGGAADSSPISYVLSEIKALREEIEHTILHVERRSFVVAGVLCGLTVLVLAVGVLVVRARDRAQDHVHYVAVKRAQSNLLSEFKRLRSENRLGRSGSKLRLLKEYGGGGGSSDTLGSDSEGSVDKMMMPRNLSLPSYLGKGDANASSSRAGPSPLAAAVAVGAVREEGRESLVEEAKDALQSLKNACHFTLGRSDSDASLRELEGVTQLPERSSTSSSSNGKVQAEKEMRESQSGEGKGESGAAEDRRRQLSAGEREEKPSFVMHSAETIGQLSRSSSKEKLHQH